MMDVILMENGIPNRSDDDRAGAGGGGGGGGGDGKKKKKEDDTDSDDSSFDLSSLFSDVGSLGEDMEQAAEEAKKFFTQLGCLVAVFGVTTETAFKVAEHFEADNYKMGIANACLLGLIHFPTLVALVIILLKDWVKTFIKGCIMARDKLDDLDGDTDDSKSNKSTKVKSSSKVNGTKPQAGVTASVKNGAKLHGNGTKDQTNVVKRKTSAAGSLKAGAKPRENSIKSNHQTTRNEQNRRRKTPRSVDSVNGREHASRPSNERRDIFIVANAKNLSESSTETTSMLSIELGDHPLHPAQVPINGMSSPDITGNRQRQRSQGLNPHDTMWKPRKKSYDSFMDTPRYDTRPSTGNHDNSDSPEHIFRQYFNIDNRRFSDQRNFDNLSPHRQKPMQSHNNLGAVKHQNRRKEQDKYFTPNSNRHPIDFVSKIGARGGSSSSSLVYDEIYDSAHQSKDGSETTRERQKPYSISRSQDRKRRQKETGERRSYASLSSEHTLPSSHRYGVRTAPHHTPTDNGRGMGRDNQGFSDNGLDSDTGFERSRARRMGNGVSKEMMRVPPYNTRDRPPFAVGIMYRAKSHDDLRYGRLVARDDLDTRYQLPNPTRRLHSTSEPNTHVVELDSEDERILKMFRRVRQGDVYSESSQYQPGVRDGRGTFSVRDRGKTWH